MPSGGSRPYQRAHAANKAAVLALAVLLLLVLLYGTGGSPALLGVVGLALALGPIVRVIARAVRARRDRRDAVIDAEVDTLTASMRAASSKPRLVVFLVALPSTRRDWAEARLPWKRMGAHAVSSGVVDALVVPEGARLFGTRVSLSAGSSTAASWASQALDQLAERDRATPGAYRDARITASREGPGLQLLALAFVVRGAGPRHAFDTIDELRRAVSAAIPIETSTIEHVAVRWIPSTESAAFDEDDLRRLYPELRVVDQSARIELR